MFCTSSVPHSASPFPVERLEQVFPSIRYWLARWSRRSIESTQIVVKARHVPKPVQLTWANYLCSSANSGGQTRAPDVPRRCFNRWYTYPIRGKPSPTNNGPKLVTIRIETNQVCNCNLIVPQTIVGQQGSPREFPRDPQGILGESLGSYRQS